jgi:16S rRNA (guanine527-N7)-methyltransferase
MDNQFFVKWVGDHYPHTDECRFSAFEKYKTLLEQWNDKINLLSRGTDLDIYEKHFIDSLLFTQISFSDGQTGIDLGSGAGFPGIPLKLVFPTIDMTLLEPTNKRARFLENVIDELRLDNIKVIASRAEEYVTEAREKFDFLCARAVAPLSILLELAAPLIKTNGHIYLYKGDKVVEELKDANIAMKSLSLRLTNHYEATLPILGHNRHLLVLKKLSPTPLKYPRPYASIKRQPL